MFHRQKKGSAQTVNCVVEFVNKNMRYNLLTINEETYIFDKDRSFWVFFFPFAIWLTSYSVFKIDEKSKIDQLKNPKDSQFKSGLFSVFGVGLSILLANLLRPIMDYFNIQMTALFTYSILLFAFIIIISIRKYLSKVNKKSLCNIIEVEKLKLEKIRIRPKSVNHFLKFLFSYLFILAFNILSVALFIEFGNMMILLFFMIFALVLFIFNIATVVPGRTKIKFVNANSVGRENIHQL
ncbi:DUF443 family protein [Virgibacillus halodenitrificans]|uniref:DUF443 family protein n=1 Tax=Virgibacillus halodenitrificans TaxID=1482 RepID=UPI00045CEBB3|nr:DUF443 family protein [Virgibacillus halodenitrificans]MEC2158236.1 DUF443 family protein [Virgibacillus halodenitrificans]CDQ31141.1 tandem five-TM protein [Virgibacillus halodenitrificans]